MRLASTSSTVRRVPASLQAQTARTLVNRTAPALGSFQLFVTSVVGAQATASRRATAIGPWDLRIGKGSGECRPFRIAFRRPPSHWTLVQPGVRSETRLETEGRAAQVG